MKKDSSIHMILTLVIIAVIVGGLMSFVNGLTAPIIEENNFKALNNSLSEIIPAENYQTIVDGDTTIYLAYNGEDKAGVLVSCVEQGYGGALRVLTGIDDNGCVVGVDILESSETAGLGANASNPSFINQFIGKKGTIGVSKTWANETDIKAITGATITSKAVTAAVNNALNIAEKYQEG